METQIAHGSGKRITAIAGYTVLGCAVFTVAVSFLCWAICSATKKRQHQISQAQPQTSQAKPQISQVQPQTSQIEEEHYEELTKIDRRTEQQDDPHCYTPVRPSVCVNHYNESDLPGPLPSPPLPPDVRDLNGRRPLDICPEGEQHYNNRTMIMATIPRKDRVKIPKTQSLEDIIEYCKGSYHVKCEGSSMEDASAISGVVQVRLDSSEDYAAQKKSLLLDERMSELYMDMSGITAEQKESIDL